MATDRPQPSAFKFVAALIIYLAPLVILGAGFAVYQFYQAENMRIAQMRVDEERNQASRFVEILEQYATSSREQVMAAAETHLATLPLPLDELPLMQLRELPLTLTERAFTNGKLTLVSVNPEHRQFYYENRNTNNDFVFLATLGETIGPQAVGTDGAYYMLLVAPTSNNNWVVVAELPGDALQVAFEASLAPESSVALRQAGSISDQLSLFKLGPSHSGPASTTIDHGDWSIDYWPATGEYTVTNNTQQLLPLLYTLATGFFVSVLLILLRIRANLRRAAALEDEDDTELFSQTQIRSAAELSSRSASSSAFGQDQNSLSTPATNDALTRPPAQHLETPLGQTDHYSLVRAAPISPQKYFEQMIFAG